jgi:hypothetical protein
MPRVIVVEFVRKYPVFVTMATVVDLRRCWQYCLPVVVIMKGSHQSYLQVLVGLAIEAKLVFHC